MTAGHVCAVIVLLCAVLVLFAVVPVFVKQLGGHPDKRTDPAAWPEDLRIREFPMVAELADA